MTDTDDAYARYEAQQRVRDRLAEQAASSTKEAVFDALAGAGAASVTVTFDGSCDDGQIESLEAYDAQNATVALPATDVAVTTPLWDGSGVETSARPLAEVIEALAYSYLERTHEGWENGDGAYGEFTFDVAARTVTLGYNERVVQSDYSEHEF
jgi:hypothetical protein